MHLILSLPDELQMHVYKMYTLQHVLPDLVFYIKYRNFCKGCMIHGLPCIQCAGPKYGGHLGPAYYYGKRYMFYTDFHLNVALTNFLLPRFNSVRMVTSLDDIDKL